MAVGSALVSDRTPAVPEPLRLVGPDIQSIRDGQGVLDMVLIRVRARHDDTEDLLRTHSLHKQTGRHSRIDATAQTDNVAIQPCRLQMAAVER